MTLWEVILTQTSHPLFITSSHQSPLPIISWAQLSSTGSCWTHCFFLSCWQCFVLFLSDTSLCTETSWGFLLLSPVARLGNSNTQHHKSSLLTCFLTPDTVITLSIPLCPSCLIFRVLGIFFPDMSLFFCLWLQCGTFANCLIFLDLRVSQCHSHLSMTTELVSSLSMDDPIYDVILKAALCHSLHFYILVEAILRSVVTL